MKTTLRRARIPVFLGRTTHLQRKRRRLVMTRLLNCGRATKTQPTEKVQAIKVGSTDMHGNQVSHVHASGNDYVIYEIQHADIGNRLRVLIDCRNDAEEQLLKEKFARVKMQYTEAKGLLYRSPNFGMMKNRIAHTLASHFTLPGKEGAINEFDKLVAVIKKEHENGILHRVAYLLPSMASVTALFTISLVWMELRTENTSIWQILMAAMAAALGGSMSILLKMKDVNFEEYQHPRFYLLAGIERLFLALVAGAIALVLVKAKLLLPHLLESSYWGLMTIAAAAGFSEAFVPRYIGNVDRA